MDYNYYLLFAITTAICITLLNIEAKRLSQVEVSTFTFYCISFLLAFCLAPLFLVIYLFYSKSYKRGIVEALNKAFGEK